MSYYDFVPGLEQQDFPTCPHCNCMYQKVNEEHVTDDTSEHITCRACEKGFSVVTHVTVTYSTEIPLDDEDGEAA